MSTAPIRRIARGPHKDKLAVIVQYHPTTGLFDARVAAAVGDPAPSPYDTKIQITRFQPSYLKPL